MEENLPLAAANLGLVLRPRMAQNWRQVGSLSLSKDKRTRAAAPSFLRSFVLAAAAKEGVWFRNEIRATKRSETAARGSNLVLGQRHHKVEEKYWAATLNFSFEPWTISWAKFVFKCVYKGHFHILKVRLWILQVVIRLAAPHIKEGSKAFISVTRKRKEVADVFELVLVCPFLPSFLPSAHAHSLFCPLPHLGSRDFCRESAIGWGKHLKRFIYIHWNCRLPTINWSLVPWIPLLVTYVSVK